MEFVVIGNVILLLFLFPTVIFVYRSKIANLREEIESMKFFKQSKQKSYANRWFKSSYRPFFNPRRKATVFYRSGFFSKHRGKPSDKSVTEVTTRLKPYDPFTGEQLYTPSLTLLPNGNYTHEQLIKMGVRRYDPLGNGGKGDFVRFF